MTLCREQAVASWKAVFQLPIWSANQVASHTSPDSSKYSSARSTVQMLDSFCCRTMELISSWYLGRIRLSG